ncbi:MAG: hypothetical protein Q7S76_00385 [bacterium]|nr:hypothetical protein [bacterium]
MNTTIDFTSVTADKSCWELLQELHNAILSTSKAVEYRIFPIYIRYEDGERTIALIFFRGKRLVESGGVELGLNVGNAKLPKGFDDGKQMKYPEINCGIKLAASTKLTKQLLDAIALTKL